MLKAIFTSDYEIHGNGEGCPQKLMVEPTDRMLRQFEEYGAKLTILADIGEILKFKSHAEQTGRDDCHYELVAEQLRDAVRRGHDVQLHIHASYFNSKYEEGRWVQDWSEYNFAGLPPARLRELIKVGREFLEDLLKPVKPGYRCFVFRAANWSVSPSKQVVRALVDAGIQVDTSVFKYGQRRGLVNFDYSAAHSDLVPWRVREDDICSTDTGGALWEFPIYSEHRWIGAFFSLNRIRRACVGRMHRLPSTQRRQLALSADQSEARESKQQSGLLFRKHAWKADFNQCTGRQLVRALKRAERTHVNGDDALPFVLIGHSKLFTRANEASLEAFLAFIRDHPDRFGFGTYADFGEGRWPALPSVVA